MMSVEAKPHLSIPTKRVLGHEVAALTAKEAAEQLQSRLHRGEFSRIAFLNSHVANIAAEDTAYAQLLQNFLVLPDGIGVDIAAWLKDGQTFPANLNGTDFMPFLLERLHPPLHVGLIGAKLDSLNGAVEALKERFPQNRFTAFSDGYFDAGSEHAILEHLKADKPDLLMVALGVPAQENWIVGNLDQRHCTLVFGVGALFDFLAGAVPRAPKLVRRLRSEWVWRLALEPRRLFARYVIGNPRFLYRVLIDRSGR
ncbi:WecB/TagA/CpsF family glycosyltransferase [Notoacmeibacter sp. MSK16QG-6]|uniref:WecB/TagA/CpsF family glycosyltransferase n=1 Tax=Notoacmeibacter sp. MSK16QG-6 TaxID=2957982 RepID=UPI00209DE55F|nr:WecB/TagA/CpsF family glycosyltransferase [Notoacmeibacter sp. MSK16QG-6]MCP1198559.1 WecB/TagA/CpsF family glycosyltransferase [Notoacmeibacter sp. MSK16QG-6]